MKLELFLLFCILLLWMGVQGYLEKIKPYLFRIQHFLNPSIYTNGIYPSQGDSNLFLKGIIILGLLIILFPKLLKWLLSPFRGNKQTNNPIKMLQEYNFVSSIRDITDKAKKKTNNWVESRKELIIKSQRKKCFDCELPMDSPQLTHKIPLHRGGTNDMSNLKAVCETCNFRTEIQNSYL